MQHHPGSKFSFSFFPACNHTPSDSNTSPTEDEQSYPPPSPKQSRLSGTALHYHTNRQFLEKS